MIDPKELLAASAAVQQFGPSAHAALSASFVNAVPGMSIASSENASKIIDGVHQASAKMLKTMSTLKNSVDHQVFAHQDAQRRQKSYDFQPDMRDLRPTDAQGFPQELADRFFAPFMKANK
ncbi:MAG TPA: DUF6277 family protein [Burkholderiaceae bacterium]|jgi:hypothetical protein